MKIPQYITQITKEWFRDVSKRLVCGHNVRITETDETRVIDVDLETVVPSSPANLGGGVGTGKTNTSGCSAGTFGGSGMELYVCCAAGNGGATSRLFFRKLVFTKDGRLASVAAPDSQIDICTDI